MRTTNRTISAILTICAAVALNLVGSAQQAPPVDLEKLGPRVGERVPAFSGTDQLGRTQTLESVMKAEGVMLVFNRSADW